MATHADTTRLRAKGTASPPRARTFLARARVLIASQKPEAGPSGTQLANGKSNDNETKKAGPKARLIARHLPELPRLRRVCVARDAASAAPRTPLRNQNELTRGCRPERHRDRATPSAPRETPDQTTARPYRTRRPSPYPSPSKILRTSRRRIAAGGIMHDPQRQRELIRSDAPRLLRPAPCRMRIEDVADTPKTSRAATRATLANDHA